VLELEGRRVKAADQLARMFKGTPRVRSAAELAPQGAPAQLARAFALEARRCDGRCIRMGGMLCTCSTSPAEARVR